MKRSLTAVALLVSLLVSLLAACGGDGGTTVTSPGPTDSTTASEPAATGAPSEPASEGSVPPVDDSPYCQALVAYVTQAFAIFGASEPADLQTAMEGSLTALQDVRSTVPDELAADLDAVITEFEAYVAAAAESGWDYEFVTNYVGENEDARLAAEERFNAYNETACPNLLGGG